MCLAIAIVNSFFMRIHMRIFILLPLLLLFSFKVMAAPFKVAITVDDLPVHMDLPSGETRLDVVKQILLTLNKHSIKNVYGFINAGHILNNDDNYNVLRLWVSSGQLLGNHTYNHVNLDTETTLNFIQQIQMNESYLSELMKNKNYHYFRYPYLHEGNTQEKRNTVRDYLFSHNYQIAQITMDFSDYLWNNPYARCVKKGDNKSIEWLKKSYIEHAINSITIAHELSMLIFHRDINNILLLHIGAFDALMLDDLLTAYEKNGVKFISLHKGLLDEVYNINPNVAKENTDTFFTQMLVAKKLPVPEIVKQLLASIPEEKLDKLCR